MNIDQLIGGRKFSKLRGAVQQFLILYPKWARAKSLGGSEKIEGAVRNVITKNGDMSSRAVQFAASKLPAIGSMLQSGQALNMAPTLVSSLVCSGGKGDYDEMRVLMDQAERIERLVEELPEWGENSVSELQNDSALLADLQRFSEFKTELEAGGPSSAVGSVLSMLG